MTKTTRIIVIIIIIIVIIIIQTPRLKPMTKIHIQGTK